MTVILPHRLRRLCPDAGLATLLLLPFVLLLVNSNWIYNDALNDAWIYFGCFQDLPAHLRLYRGYYPEGRLTVLLPGWLAYRFLPPALATHVLHLGVYYLGVLSLYSLLRHTLGRRSALLCALILGCHHFYLRAAGGDYVDGWATGYFLLACAFVERASASPRWRIWLLAAGMAAAAVVVANLALVLLLPTLTVAYGFLAASRGPRHLLAAAGWCALGGGLLVVGLGFIAQGLGAPFFFLESSLTFARNWVRQTGGQNPYLLPWHRWLPDATWLVVPLAVAVGSVASLLAWLVKREGTPLQQRSLCLFFQIQYLAMVGLALALQGSGRNPYLQYYFCTGPLLLPFLTLALAGQWQCWLDRLPPRAFRCLALFAFLWLAGSNVAPPPTVCLVVRWIPALALFGYLASAAVLLGRLPHPRLGHGMAALTLLGLVNLGLTARFRLNDEEFGPSSTERLASFDPGRKRCFRSIWEGTQLSRQLGPPEEIFFWYDERAPLGNLYNMMAIASAAHRRTISQAFPHLRPDARTLLGAPLQPGMKVVVFTQGPAPLDRARASLQPLGLDIHIASVHALGQRGPGRFQATVITLIRTRPVTVSFLSRPVPYGCGVVPCLV